ncbi:MAG TPA: hypothetical protein VFJ20_11960, partial [Gemmatimonadaceae bacterium]|nr:hypothetical protein [Gemmatimonadaceae bacterium]
TSECGADHGRSTRNHLDRQPRAAHTVITTIKVERIAGICDNAFYQVFPADSPMLCVLKGKTAFSLRIITRLKPAPFTTEQEKSKEAVLAKAVVAKL